MPYLVLSTDIYYERGMLAVALLAQQQVEPGNPIKQAH
jgi:hypothetical protein